MASVCCAVRRPVVPDSSASERGSQAVSMKVSKLTVTTRAWRFSPCQVGKFNACSYVNNLVKGKSVHEGSFVGIAEVCCLCKCY